MIIVTPNRLQSRGSSINPPLNGRLHYDERKMCTYVLYKTIRDSSTGPTLESFEQKASHTPMVLTP